jgi:hypothetical protein
MHVAISKRKQSAVSVMLDKLSLKLTQHFLKHVYNLAAASCALLSTFAGATAADASACAVHYSFTV